MYLEMLSGLEQDAKDEIYSCFTEHHDDLVIVKDISFIPCVSTIWCHLYGKAHIAYLPSDGRVDRLE
ncbi:GTP cyclohydrolase I [Streptococcus equi]|uniref:GTP cyclohydrolase I n=1 Tax=Streptococcus equi TaxID=1336 RepID=UPI0022AC1CED|nr:GTP cyclohydrolase I [Streptococcus equi]